MIDAQVNVCPRCGRRYHAAAKFCQRDGGALLAEDETPDPYIGQVLLEQFRIEELVGVGGMGSVYRAHQTTLDRDVAIKILHQDLASNPDAVRRFRREAKITTALDHPNVVNVFLFGQLPDGSLYLVMEHLRGRPLNEIIGVEGRLPLERALHIATQICDGTGEAHSHGVVHRDIKPENVLIVKRGRDEDFVKVLDFGIARMLFDEQTHATQSGLIFGTARYISPEGASGEPTDSASDVYSIGVLTYQLLCGQCPFDATSPVAMLMKHIHDPAPDIRMRSGGAHVPDPIAEVVMRALDKDPKARQVDATELATALRLAAEESGLGAAAQRFRPSFTGGLTPPPAPRGSMPGYTPEGTSGPYRSMSSAAIPGLPRRSMGVVPTVLLAFVLGAAAVTSGAFLVGMLGRGEPAPVVSPTPAAEPSAPAPAPPPPPSAEPPRPLEQAGVRVLPEAPMVGQPVTLVGVLATDEGAAAGDLRWRLRLDGRPVRGDLAAGRGATSRTWIASYVFRRPGRYELALVGGRGEAEVVLLQRSVDVSRRAIAAGGAPSTTQAQAPPQPPRPVPTNGDAIDWSAPPIMPEPRPEDPQPRPPAPIEPWPGAGDPSPPPPPPEPWTGRVL